MSTLSPFKANAAENPTGWTKRADLPEEHINAGEESLMERFMCLVEQVKKIS